MPSVFFYGLFMDPEVLRARGIRAEPPQIGCLRGFSLRIGTRAALAPDPGGCVYGTLMRVGDDDLQRLYSDPAVSAYLPAAVTVTLQDGRQVDALCYNTHVTGEETPNDEYAGKLQDAARRVGLPGAYVLSITDHRRGDR